MSFFDWFIVFATIAASLVVGLWFAKRASGSEDDYFVAGRSLGWLVAGTSMVATTFSSDTPLFVSGLVREQGIYGNWIWWAMVPGALATTFFFARLWRRSGAITEIEFLVQRYDDGQGVRILRVIRALFDGAFTNALIIASVTLGMSKILVVILELQNAAPIHLPLFGDVAIGTALLAVLSLIALIYTAVSGLYGVIYTDFIQFVIAMIGAIALAVIVYVDLGGGANFVAAVQAAPEFKEGATFAMVPDLSSLDVEAVSFLILICFSWIGASPGSGHFVQRILATRSERDAMLSMYWYAFTNYALRSWPWIITGLASLVYFPHLIDNEQAYPELVNRALPIGLKGVMLASLISAFMSTLTTQLNWGTSYMINDIYRPYIVPNRQPHHYVTAARIGMLVIVMLALLVGSHLQSVLEVYKYLAVMTAGGAFLAIARWYWWRVSVWSEIVSILTSLTVGISLFWILPDTENADYFAHRLAINMAVTTVIVLVTTMIASRAGPTEQATSFYKRLRVAGPGWSRIAKQTGISAESGDLHANFLSWLGSVALIYGLLFGLGYALLADWQALYSSIAVVAVASLILAKYLPAVMRELSILKSDGNA